VSVFRSARHVALGGGDGRSALEGTYLKPTIHRIS
jgi:hypothetical protein